MNKTHDIIIDRTKLHPWLNYKLTLLLKQCAKKRIYLIITQGFRSKAQQDELYAQARTKKGNIVTNAKGSDYSSFWNKERIEHLEQNKNKSPKEKTSKQNQSQCNVC